MKRRWLAAVATAVLVTATSVVAIGAPSAKPAHAEGVEYGPAGTMMLGLEEGAAGGTSNALVGWGLSAIGVDDQQNVQLTDIDDELNVISGQLTDIENELTTLNDEIAQQTCTLETSDTTNAAVATINSLSETYADYLDGATTDEIETFVNVVLDDTTGVAYQLSVINTALFDEGISDGIIPTCLATLTPPADGTAGDLPYYDAVANLEQYFYTIQVQGLNLIVEALHAEAANAWVDANGLSAITASQVPSVCDDTSDVTVVDYCNQAVAWMTSIYDNIQQQFAYAGAPYSVYESGSTSAYGAASLNGTPYAFVTSLEDFTAAEGADCATPLDSSDPCGPLVGTNLTSSIPQTVPYASRTNWTTATPAVWQDLLSDWTDSSETLGTYLAGLGFQNTTNSTKVFLTNTTYTATPTYSGDIASPFSAQAVCFGDTSAERSLGHEPFCYNGSNDGEDYGEASDLLGEHWQSDPYLGCAEFYAPSELTDEDTNGFYDGTYGEHLSGETCPFDGWDNGVQPGWLLDEDGASASQFLWPMFDMSTATCNANDNGSARSTTNAVGVYTLCGDDFDTWFAAIVPSPTDNIPPTTPTTTTSTTTTTTAGTTPTATVSPSTVAAGDSVTVTTSGWDSSSSLTTSVQSTPVVLDQAQVDGSGRYSRTLTVPLDLEPGAHTLHFDGTFRGAPHSVVISLTVRPASAANPSSGSLATTGVALAAISAVAAGLLLLGAGLFLAARRRRAAL
jgi:hypothetical protein